MTTQDDDTKQLHRLITDLIGQCNLEVHQLTELSQWAQAIDNRLSSGNPPTLNELEVLFKMNDLAIKHKSVVGAIKSKRLGN